MEVEMEKECVKEMAKCVFFYNQVQFRTQNKTNHNAMLHM